MNKKERPSSGSLLMLELIFAIVFFALAIAVTVSVFGKAYVLSSKATAIDMAVAETNDIAEMIRSSDSEEEIEGLISKKGMKKVSDGKYEMSYGEGKFSLDMNVDKEGKLYSASMVCVDNGTGEDVYDILIQHALKGGGDE